MRKIILTFLFLSFILCTLGCDDKSKIKYVTQSVYNNLEKKYQNLEIKNKLLERKNKNLNNENEILKHDLQKYKNGFNSMYE